MTELVSFTIPVSTTLENPFPGLRPFHEDEEHLFFGREHQVDRMVDKLAATRFLAVVGTSGTGKSSLVNCGLKPALHRGLMASAGTSWCMIQFRPGGSPIRAMAQAFAQEPGFLGEEDPGGLSLFQIAQSTLRMSSLGLADLYRFARLAPGTNLLVVVDQFEELFRYSKAAGATSPDGVSGDAIAFVNLLLEPLSHPEYPIYIVLTMRSDFLGECSKFDGLPEVINESQYLVPRLTRDERRAAIAGPVRVVGGELNPVLLTRTINDVGDNPDQLSIMQHAINRTWAHWQEDRHGEGVVALEDYEAVGTMARALDEHADEAYGDLEPGRQRTLCEKVFKALTDRGTDARGIRRPMPFQTLCSVVGATPEELTPVLKAFRDPSRSFLMPPLTDALEAGTVIDISHEILMRVWERLKRWADEEAQSASTYRRLAESAELFAAGKEALLRNPGLQAALDWQYSQTPNAAWAQLYRAGFDKAIEFLKKSKDARDKERAEAVFERQFRRLTPYLIGIAFIAFLFISPKISDWLRPSIKPHLIQILKRHEKAEDLTTGSIPVNQTNQPKFAAKSKAKLAEGSPASEINAPPGLGAITNLGREEFGNRAELAETIVNTLGYGLGGLTSSLLYLALWSAGKRAYRRFAFPGILIQAGARPPAARGAKEPEPKRGAASRTDSSVALSASAPVDLVMATIWRRLLAGLVDFCVFMTLGIVAIGFVIFTEDALKIANGTTGEDTCIFGIWLLSDYLYQALTRQWVLHGTLGELACGLSVTDRNGRLPSFGRNSARYLLRALPWLVSYGLNTFVRSGVSDAEAASTMLGFEIICSFFASVLAVFTIPFTPRKQSIYDMIAGTLVVRRPKKAKPPANRFDPAEAA
ncbi:nSTAND1 domain-containing NTPase [Acidicapsa acidisoli]|uniref:nSTAND1 domain-containing NTPase n=1 Tax=Acidicapsa acidisoli TaxID=1615681 RepID=UPI0021E09B46|nr:RDD family protein [Acidicapsa acidisoli]